MTNRKSILKVWKRTISLTTASVVFAAMLPVSAQPVFADELDQVKKAANRTNEKLIKAGSLCATDETMTIAQPFPTWTGGSYNFRIPCLISMERGNYKGNLVVAADARYSTPGDGGGLDTIASVSEDMGKTWSYSYPIWFPDSEGYASKNATTVIDPALVEGPDGTVYCMADVNPSGITTHYGGIPEGNGYVEIDGKEYLALTDNHSKAGGNPETNAADYAYYVGDFDKGYAPVLNRSDGSATDWRVDEWYNIEKKVDGEFQPILQKQVNTDQDIQQNVLYKDSELHVYNIGYIWVVESKDGGKSWVNPRIINDQIKAKTGENAILVSPGKGITTTKDVITVPFYSQYGGQEKASFIYSKDNGETWKRTNTVNHLPAAGKSSESEMVELSDGTLRMFSRTAKNALNKICYTDVIETEDGEYEMGDMVSTDAAAWSDCNVSAIRYSKQADGKDLVLVSCPSGGNRRLGKIYAFLVNNDAEKTMELLGTFDIEDPEGGDAFAYSCMAELENGEVGIIWEPTASGYIGENPYRLLYDSYHILQIAPTAKIDGVTEKPSEPDAKKIVLEKGASHMIKGNEASVEDEADAIRTDAIDRYFLCDDKTSKEANQTAALENTLMTFTRGKSDDSWQIKNEFINHYLTNSDNFQIYYFNPVPEDMTVEEGSDDGGTVFRIKNKKSGSYVYYNASQTVFDRMAAYNANQTDGTYDFVLLTKKETVSDDDLIPGYERVSEIVPDEQYLLVCVYEGNTTVLYPYAEDCASWAGAGSIWNSSRRKRAKFYLKDVSKVKYQMITGLVPDKTAEVTVDGERYQIQVENPVSAQAVQTIFLNAQKEAADYREMEKGDYSSETWNALQSVCREILRAENTSVSNKKELIEKLNLAKKSLILLDRAAEEQKAKEGIQKAENDYQTGAAKYTKESFEAFKKAYDALNNALLGTGGKTDVEELQKLCQDLLRAQKDLKEIPNEEDKTEQKPAIEEGKTYVVGDYSYRVISLSNQTVAVNGLSNQSLKKISLGKTVVLGDKTYSITAIDNNAFLKCKNVTQVTVAANIETIGSSAFSGCSKLTKVTINSTKLKKIGKKAFYNCKKLKNITLKTKKLTKIEKDAFKKIHKKAAVKVPKSKYKAYVKRFKKVKFKK